MVWKILIIIFIINIVTTVVKITIIFGVIKNFIKYKINFLFSHTIP